MYGASHHVHPQQIQIIIIIVMKYYDYASQYAVDHNMPWIFLLEPLCGACASVNDSVRIRTDTTLDQDCVLKATVQVCTACMIVSEFEHSSSRAGCTFSVQDSRVQRGRRLPHDSGLDTSTSQAWSTAQHGPDKASVLSIILALHWALEKSSPITPWRHSVHKMSYCLLLLLSSCFAH